MWFPWKGRLNQIQIYQEKHIKIMVIELKGMNESIMFLEASLGNYFLTSSSLSNYQI
jgi:hypothetical protein